MSQKELFRNSKSINDGLARRELEIKLKKERLLKMRIDLYSQKLHLGEVKDRESAIEGLLLLKGHEAVMVMADWLPKETDGRLREKLLDAIEECIVLKPVSYSFSLLRKEQEPTMSLADYARNLACNYTHTLAAA